MPAYNYRSPYSRKRPAGNTGIFRVIIVIILCGVLAWILYKGNVFKLALPASSEQTPAPSSKTLLDPPSVIINLDGVDYTIPASEDSDETSIPEDPNVKVIGMGKNSKAQFTFETAPDSFRVTLYQNDTEALSIQNPMIFAQDLPSDGDFHGVCEATWSQGNGFIGTAIYQFIFSVDFPPIIESSATELNPGELLVLTVKYLNPDEKLEVETDLDFKPNIFEYDNEHIILLPVSYYNEADKIYQVKVLMGEETYSLPVKVNDKEFITQYMTIDTKVAAETRNDKSAAEVKEKVDPLRPVVDDKPYWIGKFIMPVENGRVNEADFGKRRYVNNAPTSYRHNGLDIGQDKGVPVMASNDGRVLLADYLIGTGNTVIIEHGFGLKTWYYHMNELNVKTGDMVKKADVIGKVGSTGFSTGPHLHFSASVNNVYINPITLVNAGIQLVERDE